MLLTLILLFLIVNYCNSTYGTVRYTLSGGGGGRAGQISSGPRRRSPVPVSGPLSSPDPLTLVTLVTLAQAFLKLGLKPSGLGLRCGLTLGRR